MLGSLLTRVEGSCSYGLDAHLLQGPHRQGMRLEFDMSCSEQRPHTSLMIDIGPVSHRWGDQSYPWKSLLSSSM
jgi:hypothetical protein